MTRRDEVPPSRWWIEVVAFIGMMIVLPLVMNGLGF